MHLSLRPGEKVYINGAVLRADRKVTIELLNDVDFLLEGHVLQAANAGTPLKQLYFAVQTMLIEPAAAPFARRIADEMLPRLRASFTNRDILDALGRVETLVGAERCYEALKTIRALFPLEAAIIADRLQPTQAA